MAGLPCDQTLFQPSHNDMPSGPPVSAAPPARTVEPNALAEAPRPTFGEAYEQYLTDPTQAWSARTREAYETSRRLAVAVIGKDVPMHTLSRAQCRDYIDVLRFLPRNSGKRFPKLSPRQAAERARTRGDTDLISASNANACLTNLSSFLNWAVNEEFTIQNIHSETRRCAGTDDLGRLIANAAETVRALAIEIIGIARAEHPPFAIDGHLELA